MGRNAENNEGGIKKVELNLLKRDLLKMRIYLLAIFS